MLVSDLDPEVVVDITTRPITWQGYVYAERSCGCVEHDRLPWWICDEHQAMQRAAEEARTQ